MRKVLPQVRRTALTVLFTCLAGVAQLSAASPATAPVGTYGFHTFTGKSGQSLPYRLLLPAGYNSKLKYPLVIFLHGVGERGTDNVRQVRNGAELFNTPEWRAKYPAIEIVPQCPPDDRWSLRQSDPLHPTGLTQTAATAMELIDSLKADYAVDTHRIYLIGLSMGGFGTWDWILRFPGVFAAAVPMSGGGSIADAFKLVGFPIWATHGAWDTVVAVQPDRDMIAAIRGAGGSPHYTEFSTGPSATHAGWFEALQTPGLMDFVFAAVRH